MLLIALALQIKPGVLVLLRFLSGSGTLFWLSRVHEYIPFSAQQDVILQEALHALDVGLDGVGARPAVALTGIDVHLDGFARSLSASSIAVAWSLVTTGGC